MDNRVTAIILNNNKFKYLNCNLCRCALWWCKSGSDVLRKRIQIRE